MDRLSGLDASFLYLETPAQLMHVCGVIVLDPGTMPGGYDFDTFRDELDRRVSGVAAFTRKLRRVPLGLDHPIWVRDKQFDIERHVHRLALPSPGGYGELVKLTAHLAGLPLDRSRPLWEMWVIEGFEEDKIVVFMKMHHATVDGVSGNNLLSHLCALEPDAEPLALGGAGKHGREVGSRELLGRAVVSKLSMPVQVARVLGPTLGSVGSTIGRARAGTAMAAPLTAPRTSFNGTITGHRTIALTDLSLDDIRAVKTATGTTVNDVVLSVSGGALRAYLEERDELPESSLLASVPVSVRDESKREARRQQGVVALRAARHRHRGPARAAPGHGRPPTRSPRSTTRRSAPTRSRTGPSSPRPARSASRSAPTPGYDWPRSTRWCTTW